MAWSKPFDECEIAYVRDAYPSLSCGEIAARLGRSKRGVERLAKRLGLGEPCAPARTRTRGGQAPGATQEAAQDAPQDELAEMRELKRMLKRALREAADPRAMPKLSAEYREVVKRITELEGAEDGGCGAQGVELGSLLVSVPLRPS